MKSNIYILFFFIIFFNVQKVKSQDEGGVAKQYIPNITVASPQAASISKVGEIPVDLSTGRMNYTIPIFEIKEGNFTMPINLSYNYSGLLLDETPGYAGVGWALNIGGSILHSINGLDDSQHQSDKQSIYNYINKLPPFDDYVSPQGLSTINDFTEFVANGIFDGEPDKYCVNAGNLNCSFYLDKDNNAIFLKNENYKVSGYSHSAFTITDDKGINYIFNKSLINSRSSAENSSDYIASFLLTEINFPTSTNKILFKYESDVSNQYISYSDRSVTQTLTQNSTQYGTVQSFEINKNISDTQVRVDKLKKIITNSYTIELQYNDNPTENAITVISNLSIKDKFDKAVKSYDFNYSGWTGRRTNLMNVKSNGVIMNEMEYDMSTPYPVITDDSDYAKKDLWGYYNEKGRPATINGLITPNNNPTLKPDFNSTKIGALTKITYQTKGYSIIEYETNKIRTGGNNFPYESDAPVINEPYAATTNPYEIGSEKTVTLDITSVPVDLVPRYQFTNGFEMAGEHDRTGEITLTQNGTIILTAKQYWGNEGGDWRPPQRTFMNSDPDNIIHVTVPGKYVLKATSDQGITAQLSVIIKTTPPTYDQTVGGVRVSRVQNCDFNGECITTAYNYSQDNKSTGVMLQKPEFYSGSHTQDNLQCSPAIFVRRDFYNYTSIYPLSNFRGSPVLYKTVEKIDSGKDINNQVVTNGKTIFSYYGGPVSNSIRDLESYSIIGLLRTKEVKDNFGTTLLFENNSYTTSLIPNTTKLLYLLSCKLVREKRAQVSGGGSSGAGCGLQYPRPLLDFQVASFRYQAKNLILEKEESANYLQGNIVEGVTVYDYNPDTGFLKSKTTKNSKNENLETKYFYATNAEMSSEPFRNELIAKNMIGVPLVTQSYNGEKISEQKTEYSQEALTMNLLVPKYVYANKGNSEINKTTDRKITYDKYDDKGNVLQYTLESSTPVSIIWGYNKTQPIAKIENTSYDQVASYVIDLQSFSDSDNDNCISDDCKEQILRNKLKDLRIALPQYMISTYTYNPLVGVTSVTDPKGVSSFYEYDSFNRLKFVKDKYLNVLQKYCYNYKGQQVDCSDNTSTSVYLYKSAARSGPFTKNNCAAGGTGQSVSYSQPSGAYVSTISQADADSNGLAKFNTDGQAYANNTTSIKCTFWNTAQSRLIERNNCPVGGTPASVWYTVPAGRYNSTDSQAAADAQAQAEITNNGPAFANSDLNAKCTFWNTAQSKLIERNNCPAGGTPASVWYTVPAGRYSSTDSQASADAQAQTEISNNGQAFANNDVNAKCTFWNTAQSRLIERSNCPAGGTPASVWYIVPAGRYSDFSQAGADAQALDDVTKNGPSYSNSTALCTFYSIARSGPFTKDNCEAGALGSSVPFSQEAGASLSNISQADADLKGAYKFYHDGNIYANANGTCAFYNATKSVTANKNNCGTGTYGSAVTYTVPARKYSSTISQANVDQLAQNDINSNSRTYINENGICTSETYDVFVADAEESQKKFWVTVTSSSSDHPERVVHATFNYSYIIGMKIYNGNWSSSLVLPAGVTNKTFILTLSFLGFPELKSFTVN
ncbi:hypothetical protein ASF10_23305 [Flavobacterium sp. Leaf82]|jgi:hypothetical protein|uniref:DUF5977 domain-containing protein n=1 Tax=unclassified Flavobacterium TaxID=196869 RepID=UPI0006FEAE17|nr:DUF5977 domain-containing protein [Flavobacterium sp. Leaf82]KQO27272.1 hypothetical protein ASF10_23305 [Flavobacterium sp. Leaf82]